MNTNFLGGLVFVVVFAGIILLHEIGHFSVARLFKIDVEEFGFGLPPRIWRMWRGKGWILVGKDRLVLPRNFDLPFDHKTSLHRPVNVDAVDMRGRLTVRAIDLAALEDGQFRPDASTERQTLPNGNLRLTGILNEAHPGTEFTLNWIPLGGFNKFPGEDNPDLPGGLASANPWKRIAVLFGGAVMNLLTAVIVYSVLFSQWGIPSRQTAIASVNEGSPAQLAGLQADDIVSYAAGVEIHSNSELIETTYANLGVPMDLVILRDGEEMTITVTPRAEPPEGEGPMGVTLKDSFVPAKTWFHTLPASVNAVGQDISNLLSLPGRLIAGTLSPQEAQMGGPRTIWNLFQQSVSRDVASRQVDETTGEETSTPTNYTLLIIISLTVTVGVANLLPIPALDGGRIFMALIEIVSRRRIPAKYQMAINGVSYIILLLLLGFFYIKDIINPVAITLP